MHLAILHYHLNRGGVTQVIRNHLRAVSAASSSDVQRVAILYGGRHEAWPETVDWPGSKLDVQLVPLEALEYDDFRGAQRAEPSALARTLRQVLANLRMPPDETLLHVHNHSVGKNASLPGALAELAREGYRLLLEIHDFAEDFRPDNYRHLAEMLETKSAAGLAARLYPQADHVHYAVLNDRDRAILEHAFGDGRRVHLLPNPVELPGPLPDATASRRKLTAACDLPAGVPLAIYPVRGIRRKNIGEMLLWSAVLRQRAMFILTLRPINPAETRPYDRWVALAEELRLGCRFGTSEAASLNFLDNLAASDLLFTTSVAEGFGMVFLEAALCRRPLIGRDLPEITADFKRQGVRFPWLRRGALVPAEALDRTAAREGLVAAYADVQRAYGFSPDEAELHRRAEQALEGEHIDFAVLTPALQADLIRRLGRDARLRDNLFQFNHEQFQLPERADDAVARDLAHNAAVVEERYGLRPSGRRLIDLYERVMASSAGPVAELAGGDAILNGFVDIRRLHPVRLEK